VSAELVELSPTALAVVAGVDNWLSVTAGAVAAADGVVAGAAPVVGCAGAGAVAGGGAAADELFALSFELDDDWPQPLKTKAAKPRIPQIRMAGFITPMLSH
jgi:hypothetical protein